MARKAFLDFDTETVEEPDEPERIASTPHVQAPATHKESTLARYSRLTGRPQGSELDRDRKEEIKMLAMHSNKSVEHYTPSDVIERARRLMGSIDLDPASSFLAQRTVQAGAWFGYDEQGFLANNGLIEPWHGNVFLNPPGGKTETLAPELSGISKSFAAIWWGKLVSEWQSGRVQQAVFLGFTLELLLSIQGVTGVHPTQFPMCIPRKRLAFDYPTDTLDGKATHLSQRFNGSQPTHGNFAVWLPPNGTVEADKARFPGAFSELGICC